MSCLLGVRHNTNTAIYHNLSSSDTLILMLLPDFDYFGVWFLAWVWT